MDAPERRTANSPAVGCLMPDASEMEDAYRRKRKELEKVAWLSKELLPGKPRVNS